jgi:hypothetical protein
VQLEEPERGVDSEEDPRLRCPRDGERHWSSKGRTDTLSSNMTGN